MFDSNLWCTRRSQMWQLTWWKRKEMSTRRSFRWYSRLCQMFSLSLLQLNWEFFGNASCCVILLLWCCLVFCMLAASRIYLFLNNSKWLSSVHKCKHNFLSAFQAYYLAGFLRILLPANVNYRSFLLKGERVKWWLNILYDLKLLKTKVNKTECLTLCFSLAKSNIKFRIIFLTFNL